MIHLSTLYFHSLLLKRLKGLYPSLQSFPIILDSLFWTWGMKRSFFETSITQGNRELNRLPKYYIKIYFILCFAGGGPLYFVSAIQFVCNVDRLCLYNNLLGWLRGGTHKVFLTFVLMYWWPSLMTIMGQFELLCSWIYSHIAWLLSTDVVQVHIL